MIALTIDTEWSPVEIVSETVSLIHSYGCKVTAFCTNEMNIEADEIAIHPNFKDLADIETPIRRLKEIFPEARGTRSHSLFSTERLKKIYQSVGISYESNMTQYYQAEITCSIMGSGLVSIPLYFADRFHIEFLADEERRFTTSTLALDSAGLKVFDFHPVHVFLNTNCWERYETAKTWYHEPERLREHVMAGPGTRSLLVMILKHIRKNSIATYTMSEVEEAYRPLIPGHELE